MAILDAITSVYDIVKQIHEKIELAKDNKGKCEGLERRIKSIEPTVRKLQDYNESDIEVYLQIVLDLKACLHDCLDYVIKVGKTGSIKSFINGDSIKEDRQDLIDRLQQIEGDLILALNGLVKQNTNKIVNKVDAIADMLKSQANATPTLAVADPQQEKKQNADKTEGTKYAALPADPSTLTASSEPAKISSKPTLIAGNISSSAVVRGPLNTRGGDINIRSIGNASSNRSGLNGSNKNLQKAPKTASNAEITADLESLKALKKLIASGKALTESDFDKFFDPVDRQGQGIHLTGQEGVYSLRSPEGDALKQPAAVKALSSLIDALSKSMSDKKASIPSSSVAPKAVISGNIDGSLVTFEGVDTGGGSINIGSGSAITPAFAQYQAQPQEILQQQGIPQQKVANSDNSPKGNLRQGQ